MTCFGLFGAPGLTIPNCILTTFSYVFVGVLIKRSPTILGPQCTSIKGLMVSIWGVLKGGIFFGALFFFFLVPVFFFCGWLVSARTVPLLQAVAGKSWNFCRVQGFATQHSFWGLGFCNPTLLLGLKVLQPNIPFRASGFCNSTFLLGLRVLQPNTSFRAQGCCKPTLLLGLKVLQPNTPFRAQGFATQHSF